MRSFVRIRIGLGWLCLAVGLCGPAAWAQAQALPKIIKDFQVPEYDQAGRLKSKVFGQTAEPQPDGRMKITDLRIQIYKEGVLEGTVWSAQCLFDRKERSVVSVAPVRLERGNMVITGVGLKWNSEDQHLEILSQVRVLLKDVKVWLKQETIQHGR